MIPYGRQDITDEDVAAVVAVLRSDYLTQGSAVPQFENAVASSVGARHAVAVNSATSALHVACLALGLREGERLWTVPNTFVASANCGLYCGARVDFVDIDPATLNMSVGRLREKLTLARQRHELPRVLVPVHFGGHPTEQQAIWHLAQEFGFSVIEDASHSIGAAVSGEPVGSCRWSNVTVFSFHPVKLITSGEGGMALTNDSELAAKMSMLRSHGITRDPRKFVDADGVGRAAPAWHYEQQMLGFNYRMTDIHAALGLSQLSRLKSYVKRRNELARRYDAALVGCSLTLPQVAANVVPAFHLYTVHVQQGSARKTRDEVVSALRRSGINANVHYPAVHLQPYYRKLGFAQGQYPAAEAHGDSAITLPLYPRLTESQQDSVVMALTEILTNG